MARSRTNAPRRTTKPAVAKKQPAASKKDPVAVPARKMAEIRNRWPALSAVQRVAYSSNASDVACEERGRETKGAGVRAEAAAWVVKMDGDMHGPHRDDIPYSPARFRFFIEAVFDLTEALAQQAAERNQVLGTKTALADRLEEAIVADKALEQALDRVAGSRPGERRDLDEESAGPTGTPEERVKRTGRLVRLARKWLGNEDEAFRVLVGDARLTEQVVATAESAADALEDARTGARATRLDPRDKPAVNRAEGRVLYEMEFAMARWDEAHEVNPGIGRLIPGPSTRGSLKGRSKPKEKTDGKKDPKKGEGGGGSTP